MFDKVQITVKAGEGGPGSISFRREKFIPFGGPDGGDGGSGGDIIIRADASITDLRRFKSKGFYRADHGGNGQGNKKHGKKGDDLIILVPAGTVVRKADGGDNPILADLEEPGQEVMVARGGRGGWGNIHFVSSTNQAPQIAQRGEVGDEVPILLEMRLIADVGIIGYPNVGKSSLLAAASSAKPKIASYPFTTLEPILGVVQVGNDSFVLAEVPGLIEGAHLGRGLGHDFLRHVMRTRMLIHLIDGTSATPVDDMIQVNNEIALFNPALAEKKQVVAVNKADLPEVQARMADIKQAFKEAAINVRFISAATGQGVPELMAEVMAALNKMAEEAVAKESQKVFRPRPRSAATSVRKEGDTFVVLAPDLARIVSRDRVPGPEVRVQLLKQFERYGVDKALEKAGVKPGDKVRCGDMEWEW